MDYRRGQREGRGKRRRSGQDTVEAEGDRKGEGKMGCEKKKDGKKRKRDEKERMLAEVLGR